MGRGTSRATRAAIPACYNRQGSCCPRRPQFASTLHFMADRGDIGKLDVPGWPVRLISLDFKTKVKLT